MRKFLGEFATKDDLDTMPSGEILRWAFRKINEEWHVLQIPPGNAAERLVGRVLRTVTKVDDKNPEYYHGGKITPKAIIEIAKVIKDYEFGRL